MSSRGHRSATRFASLTTGVRPVTWITTETPYGGRIRNDDDTDAAVGGWIEVEWAEVLRVGEA